MTILWQFAGDGRMTRSVVRQLLGVAGVVRDELPEVSAERSLTRSVV